MTLGAHFPPNFQCPSVKTICWIKKNGTDLLYHHAKYGMAWTLQAFPLPFLSPIPSPQFKFATGGHPAGSSVTGCHCLQFLVWFASNYHHLNHQYHFQSSFTQPSFLELLEPGPGPTKQNFCRCFYRLDAVPVAQPTASQQCCCCVHPLWAAIVGQPCNSNSIIICKGLLGQDTNQLCQRMGIDDVRRPLRLSTGTQVRVDLLPSLPAQSGSDSRETAVVEEGQTYSSAPNSKHWRDTNHAK